MIDACRPRSRANILLSHALADYAVLIEPHLRPIGLVTGEQLLVAGESLERAFFPLSAVVSVHERSGASDSIEVSLIGREGLIGWSALLGAERAMHGATVRIGGDALWIEVAALRRACLFEPRMFATLLHYVHVVTVQMSRSAVSQRHDPALTRVARFILMRHDRIGGDELAILHEEIGACLDVRRATVTDVLHILEGERLVRCRRGRLEVRDRGGLERVAGDSYGQPEACYRELLGPFGKTSYLARAVERREDAASIMPESRAAP